MRIMYGIILLGMIVALATCSWFARKSGKPFGKAAAILTASLMLPVAGNGIIIVSSDRVLSLVGCYLYYLGLDVSIAALIHFTFEYCRASWPHPLLHDGVYGLLVADMAQLLLNPFFHHAFEISSISVEGFDYYRMIPRIGQSVHRAVDYLLMAGVIVVFVYRVIRTPRLQKERYSVILGTLIFVTVWETVYIFSGTPIDRSMIGFGVFGLLIIYFSLYYRPMRLLDRMLSSIVYNNQQPLFLFDDRQNCIWMNRSGGQFLGLTEEQTGRAGNTLEAVFGVRHPGEEEWQDQVVLMRDGERRYLELSKVPQLDRSQKMNGFYISVLDRSDEHKALERQLYNARHDRLTGLYNRDYLYECTRGLLTQYPEEPYLVIRVEVCDLKLVNDLYGNSFGDQALRHTAEWIRDNLTENSVSGRLGGDSFGLCVPEKRFHQNEIARRLNDVLITEGEAKYHLLIHLGIYRVTDRDMETSVMYDRAELASDSIRDHYHRCIAWYDEAMREHVVKNWQLSEELGAALAEGQIIPWLQPIVDREGKTIGAEALVRWHHPTEGIRSPGTFIPVLEKNGMIADLDCHIWRKACEILARWKREGKDLFLSVNISPRDFYLLDVEEKLKALVQEYDVAPEKLRLEITETVMMYDQKKRLELLRNLQAAGFRIEMDDFGSGYSSLNLLREMPVDILKIDMGFLRKSTDNSRARAIVRQVIVLARELGITSLIEGVETEAQYAALMEMGCQLYQGYYFARPLPVDSFERYIGGQVTEERA